MISGVDTYVDCCCANIGLCMYFLVSYVGTIAHSIHECLAVDAKLHGECYRTSRYSTATCGV